MNKKHILEYTKGISNISDRLTRDGADDTLIAVVDDFIKKIIRHEINAFGVGFVLGILLAIFILIACNYLII